MGKYGLKIKNIKAGTLWGYNLGVRDRFDYSPAMLCNSLFYYHMRDNGLKAIKDESTQDIICLDFGFGSRSFEEELKRVKGTELEEKVIANKDKYVKMSKEELREKYYRDGVDITYPDGKTIHYKMLYRNPSKAKVGQVMFINEKLYKKAYSWMTMGIKLPKKNAKIVEMSAYAPLTTSTIEDVINIPVEDILILKDQDSMFRTMAKVVRSKDGKTCVVEDEEVDVVNTLWDGMALIDTAILPSWINGMALLRNHFFKACAFRTRLQLFFSEWYGDAYETAEVEDMFGRKHLVKDIKMITTDKAIKWFKLSSLMGDDPYQYWMDKINADGSMFGVVKTDHRSKLEDVQQMSYQMVNTLPSTSGDIEQLAGNSLEYVGQLKTDDEAFVRYLRKNANISNHFEMMASLYEWNRDFAKSTWFRRNKSIIIQQYVDRLKNGKITVPGDNLTVCGNPYALLLYSVGGDWSNDPTFHQEDDCIQCYAPKFKNGEYLCAIRNPHNSPNNIAYLHNIITDEMQRYFEFSQNIIAVNGIKTDIQSRMNGCDFDSDFFFVTNNAVMVKSAKIAYRDYPTIVNDLKESKVTYDNTPEEYARMDNNMARSQLGIGYSSNLAQLAMTYYWTSPKKEYYDIFIIMSVVAQIIIDGCKRLYEIDGMDEIKRITSLECMLDYKGNDFPEFMRYTRKVSTTKNGKARPNDDIQKDRQKIKNRINRELKCPMNTLIRNLSAVQYMPKINTIPTSEFFIRSTDGDSNRRQIGKIRYLAEQYAYDVYLITHDKDAGSNAAIILEERMEEFIAAIKKVRITNAKTYNRLIETSLGIEYKKCRSANLTILKTLFRMDKDKFLSNFVHE